MNDKYSICLAYFQDGDDSYWFAYHPDFGAASCSATGETREEALQNLDETREVMIEHFESTGRPLPVAAYKELTTGTLMRMLEDMRTIGVVVNSDEKPDYL